MAPHDHRHLILKATGLRAPPRDPAAVEAWLLRLVRAVRMKVLLGPFAVRCDTPGNEGVTGAVVIETSHAAVHVWEGADPFLQLDLYSCAWFGSGEVTRLVDEFAPEAVEWTVVDRNGPGAAVLEMGSIAGRARHVAGASAGLVA